jgi:hypothetical protein
LLLLELRLAEKAIVRTINIAVRTIPSHNPATSKTVSKEILETNAEINKIRECITHIPK